MQTLTHLQQSEDRQLRLQDEQGSPSEIIQKYNTEKNVAVTYSDSTKKVVRFEDLQQEDYKKMMTIHSCEPTLEDIFIKLTGEKLDV